MDVIHLVKPVCHRQRLALLPEISDTTPCCVDEMRKQGAPICLNWVVMVVQEKEGRAIWKSPVHKSLQNCAYLPPKGLGQGEKTKKMY